MSPRAVEVRARVGAPPAISRRSSRSRLRLAPALSALAACLALAGPARADSSAPANGATETERANELFRKAKAAFAAGNLHEAHRLYGSAWELKKSPDIAANLAQTELELGKTTDAARHFSYALRNLLPSSTEQQRAALEQGLAAARAEVCMLTLAIEPSGVEVSIDGTPVGTSPIQEPIFVEPGQRAIVARRAGYVTGETRVEAQKGAEQTVELTLLEAEGSPGPATPDPAPDRPSAAASSAVSADSSVSRSLVPAYVATGFAVAGIGLGVGFLVVASAKESEAEEIREGLGADNSCGAGTPFSDQCGRLDDALAAKSTATTVAVAGFAAGALAAGFATYWFVSASSSKTASAPGRLFPVVALGPRESRLGLQGTF